MYTSGICVAQRVCQRLVMSDHPPKYSIPLLLRTKYIIGKVKSKVDLPNHIPYASTSALALSGYSTMLDASVKAFAASFGPLLLSMIRFMASGIYA